MHEESKKLQTVIVPGGLYLPNGPLSVPSGISKAFELALVHDACIAHEQREVIRALVSHLEGLIVFIPIGGFTDRTKAAIASTAPYLEA